MKDNNNTTANTFVDLIRAYETDTANTNALTDLATAIVHSVLKKCYNVSGNAQMLALKRTVARDTRNAENLERIRTTAFETRYTKDGDKVTEITDKDTANGYNELTAYAYGDGMDLVQDAIVSILTETEKAKERNGGYLAPKFLETPYTVRRLKRKVWIKTAESVNGWESVETTPIQECYKAVRRSIESQRAVKTNTNGYTYLDDLSKDPDTDAETVIYRRFNKYADIGGSVTDYNGKETAYTVDTESAKDTDTLIEQLGLTAKQAKVLALRQSGYGYKAIATYLGVTQRAVAKTVKQIQTKATAIGLAPKTETVTA